MNLPQQCTAFIDDKRLLTGSPGEVAGAIIQQADKNQSGRVLVFDDRNGRQVDFDLRGTVEEIQARMARGSDTPTATDSVTPRGRGRPRLGVVSREVTLLPRHWDWLSSQPGGASVALRRLVEDARKQGSGKERQRLAREATDRFMWVMLSQQSSCEEASRALYRGDLKAFKTHSAGWPRDLLAYVRQLSREAF